MRGRPARDSRHGRRDRGACCGRPRKGGRGEGGVRSGVGRGGWASRGSKAGWREGRPVCEAHRGQARARRTGLVREREPLSWPGSTTARLRQRTLRLAPADQRGISERQGGARAAGGLSGQLSCSTGSRMASRLRSRFGGVDRRRQAPTVETSAAAWPASRRRPPPPPSPPSARPIARPPGKSPRGSGPLAAPVSRTLHRELFHLRSDDPAGTRLHRRVARRRLPHSSTPARRPFAPRLARSSP